MRHFLPPVSNAARPWTACAPRGPLTSQQAYSSHVLGYRGRRSKALVTSAESKSMAGYDLRAWLTRPKKTNKQKSASLALGRWSVLGVLVVPSRHRPELYMGHRQVTLTNAKPLPRHFCSLCQRC